MYIVHVGGFVRLNCPAVEHVIVLLGIPSLHSFFLTTLSYGAPAHQVQMQPGTSFTLVLCYFYTGIASTTILIDCCVLVMKSTIYTLLTRV